MRGIFLILVFLNFGLVACGDRTLDDYQRDRVAEEIAKIQSIAGIYDGEVVRDADGSQVGHLRLELQPDTRITVPTDRVNAQQQVLLKGNMELRDTKSRFTTFSSAFFDSNSNTFQATISLIHANRSLEMEVIGRWDGTTMIGNIEVRGFPESRTRFQLNRSTHQTTRPIRALGSENAPPEGSISERWDAISVNPNKNFADRAYLQLREVDPTSEEEFFQSFAPIKVVDAALNFNDDVVVVFAGSEWDLRTGRLHGEAKVNASSYEVRSIIFDCISILDANKDLGWNCNYNNTAVAFFSFEFRKKIK